jgi:hypothetical protein
MNVINKLLASLALPLLFGCTAEDPGTLEGTWSMAVNGFPPMTVTYRDGEEESLGIISKVKYKHDGNDVLVTYITGLAAGTTLRFTVTGKNTAKTHLGILTKIK